MKIAKCKSIFLTGLVLVLMAGVSGLGVRAQEVAAGGDVAKIQDFMKNVIALMTGMAGMIASGFLVWGGYGYITSSGNPDGLDRAKKTVYYSVIGLAISAGSYVLSNAVLEMAKNSFGR